MLRTGIKCAFFPPEFLCDEVSEFLVNGEIRIGLPPWLFLGRQQVMAYLNATAPALPVAV